MTNALGVVVPVLLWGFLLSWLVCIDSGLVSMTTVILLHHLVIICTLLCF